MEVSSPTYRARPSGQKAILMLTVCMFIGMAGTGKLLLFFFQTIPVSCGASDLVFFIDITNPPQSTVVALNSNATFTCQGDAAGSPEFKWVINIDGVVLYLTDDSMETSATGIFAETVNNYTSELIITGLQAYNQTLVSCTVGEDASLNATLTVYGK